MSTQWRSLRIFTTFKWRFLASETQFNSLLSSHNTYSFQHNNLLFSLYCLFCFYFILCFWRVKNDQHVWGVALSWCHVMETHTSLSYHHTILVCHHSFMRSWFEVTPHLLFISNKIVIKKDLWVRAPLKEKKKERCLRSDEAGEGLGRGRLPPTRPAGKKLRYHHLQMAFPCIWDSILIERACGKFCWSKLFLVNLYWQGMLF